MSQKKQAASSARAGGITDGVIWEQLLVFFFPIYVSHSQHFYFCLFDFYFIFAEQ